MFTFLNVSVHRVFLYTEISCVHHFSVKYLLLYEKQFILSAIGLHCKKELFLQHNGNAHKLNDIFI